MPKKKKKDLAHYVPHCTVVKDLALVREKRAS